MATAPSLCRMVWHRLFPPLPKPAKRVEGSLEKVGEPPLKGGASPAKLPPASPQPKIAAAKMA
jgi:hypothetical protein